MQYPSAESSTGFAVSLVIAAFIALTHFKANVVIVIVGCALVGQLRTRVVRRRREILARCPHAATTNKELPPCGRTADTLQS
jgi:hypothetical protein